MATLKQRLHRKNGSSYDVVHLETESNVVMRPSGNTVETDLTNYLPKVQDSDDVPEGLKSGQICTGTTKVFVCTNDGTVRTFKEEGGGSSVPVPDVDFTYTGEYQVIDDSDGNWRIKFFTSGNFVPLKDLLIDVFAVGGGGGGADASSMSVSGNAGGGGGYTKTEKSISLTNNITYAVSIGSGGLGNNYYQSRSTTGGISSAFNVNANGGNSKIPNNNAGYGVSGGSGSGAYGAVGGSDGSNGGNRGTMYLGGTGQGTTTREFGESTGDLYAGGGGGCSEKAGQAISGGAGGGGSGFYYKETLASRDGEANTGGGGGGGYTPGSANASRYGGNGGSGIVIIRNHRE